MFSMGKNNTDKQHGLETVTQDSRNGDKQHKDGLKLRQQTGKSTN